MCFRVFRLTKTCLTPKTTPKTLFWKNWKKSPKVKFFEKPCTPTLEKPCTLPLVFGKFSKFDPSKILWWFFQLTQKRCIWGSFGRSTRFRYLKHPEFTSLKVKNWIFKKSIFAYFYLYFGWTSYWKSRPYEAYLWNH